jgi:F-type H+-transporting ATPase subunit a
LLLFLFKFIKNFYLYESLYELLFKNIYLFILDIIIQQTHGEGIKYFPFFFNIFIFILCCNFFGLLPFSFTITAHLSITFFFALSFNLGFFFIGILKHKFAFFLLFVPQGAPKALLPLIVIIEVVSYLIRTFSLSIRLFANMMAGHCLLYIISSFVFTLIFLYS